MKQYVFNILPVSKPRMTQQDKWRNNPNHPDPRRRQRPIITAYWLYKRDLNSLCLENRFVIKDRLDISFYFAMPDSWSKKKKEQMNGQPHQSSPDLDNLVKAFKDCLTDQDAFIWSEHSRKFWSDQNRIVVFEDESV